MCFDVLWQPIRQPGFSMHVLHAVAVTVASKIGHIIKLYIHITKKFSYGPIIGLAVKLMFFLFFASVYLM